MTKDEDDIIGTLAKGIVAITALAKLDVITMNRDWYKSPKTRKQIRLIINTANNEMKGRAVGKPDVLADAVRLSARRITHEEFESKTRHANITPGSCCDKCGQRKPLFDTEMFNSAECPGPSPGTAA